MQQLKRMALSKPAQIQNPKTHATQGILASRQHLAEMTVRAQLLFALPVSQNVENHLQASQGVFGSQRSLRAFSTQNDDKSAEPVQTPPTTETNQTRRKGPKKQASKQEEEPKAPKPTGGLFQPKPAQSVEKKQKKIKRDEAEGDSKPDQKQNRKTRQQKREQNVKSSGESEIFTNDQRDALFGDALKKSQASQTASSKTPQIVNEESGSEYEHSGSEWSDQEEQATIMEQCQVSTDVLFDDEHQNLIDSYQPKKILGLKTAPKGLNLTHNLDEQIFQDLDKNLKQNQQNLASATQKFNERSQAAQSQISQIQQRKNRAYFEQTLLPYWQNEKKMAEYQMVKLYKSGLIDDARIMAYIKREQNMNIEERNTGMDKAWFDWETFKKHAYDGHFDDMEQLMDEEDRQDDKVWDDIGDAIEYEDPDELDDDQKGRNAPRDLMSAKQADSDEKLIIVDPKTGEIDGETDNFWQESKDKVIIQDWSGDENDPEYMAAVKRQRIRDILSNNGQIENRIASTVHAYKQIDLKTAEKEFLQRQLIGLKVEVNNDSEEEEMAEYGPEELIETTEKNALLGKIITDFDTNEAIRANEDLEMTPHDYAYAMHRKIRQQENPSDEDSDFDVLPLEWKDEPGILDANDFDEDSEELDDREMGYYQTAFSTKYEREDDAIKKFFYCRQVLRFLANVSPDHLQPYVIETPHHLYNFGDDFTDTQNKIEQAALQRTKTADGQYLKATDYIEAEETGVRILHKRVHFPKIVENSSQIDLFMTACDTENIGFSSLSYEERLQQFHDALRNRYGLSQEEFKEKLAVVLGNVDSEHMPHEFKEYFAQFADYSGKHPGNLRLHQIGWENFAEMKHGSMLPDEIRQKYDYNSESIPQELQETFQKYYSRKISENISQAKSQDPNVNQLIKFMKDKIEQEEPITDEEVSEIAKMINKIDQKYETQMPQLPKYVGLDESKDRMRIRRQMEQFQNKLKDRALLLQKDNEQLTSKKVSQLGGAQYKAFHQKALKQMTSDFPNLAKVMTNYGLDQDEHFAALITDIFVNTSRESLSKKNHESSLLLNRFSRLLLLLDDKKSGMSKQMFDEIRKAYRPTDATKTELKAFDNLSSDSQFLEKFTLMQLAKLHNKYGMVDTYLRQFAKAIINTRKSGNTDLADKLEQILNSDIIIRDPSKETFAHLSPTEWQKKPKETYQTADHRVIRQKEFRFLPQFAKIRRLDERDRLEHELKKTQELREMLDWNCEVRTQQKLMQSFDGVQQILKHIDDDRQFTQAFGKIQDQLEMQRLKKIELTLNELATQLFSNTLEMDGIDWNNMEQVFNPLYSGVFSVAQQKQNLVQKGLSEQMADKLATQYLNNVYDTGNQFTILDFFSNEKAKRALHSEGVSFDDLCFNFTTQSTNYGHDLETFKSQYTAPKRMQPIRPSGGLVGSITARLFSTGKSDEEIEKEQEEELKVEKKSKFLDFLRTAEDLDTKILQNPDLEKQVGEEPQEEPLSFSPDDIDLDISFSPSRGQQEMQDQLLDEQNMLESDELAAQPAFQPVTQATQRKIRSAEEEAWQAHVLKSKKRYDNNFFQQFAHGGPYAEYMTQRAIEEYITNELTENEDIIQFLTSLINSAYEINDFVPNAEQMFFNIFVSPVTTKKMRKGTDSEDLLVGNLFKQNDLVLPKQIYKSLIETVALKPNKRHYKRIIEHILTYQEKDKFDPELLDMLIFVGIQEKYPLTLGKTVKYMLQNDYKVNKESFKEFYLFLERCKGFEEDAKQFILMTNKGKQIQLDYDLIRPFFLRTMKKKSGQEVLKLFEQFRKGLKLNHSYDHMNQEDKYKVLREIKKNFYDGLIKDLIDLDAYQLAQIVFGEKLREKYETTLQDQMIALQIYASQGRMADYRIKFLELTDENSEYKLEKKVCEQIAGTLARFKDDVDRPMVIDMLDTLMTRVLYRQTHISSKFFDSMIHVFVEGQQFDKIVTLLSSTTQKNCSPEPQIMKYLKRNMMYIFDKNQKDQVRNAIDQFEKEFFSLEAQKRKKERAQIQEIRSMQKNKKEESSESLTIDVPAQEETQAKIETTSTA